MYYLSSMSVVYAIKFTHHNSKKEEKVKEEVAATVSVAVPPPTAEAFSQIPVE